MQALSLCCVVQPTAFGRINIAGPNEVTNLGVFVSSPLAIVGGICDVQVQSPRLDGSFDPLSCQANPPLQPCEAGLDSWESCPAPSDHEHTTAPRRITSGADPLHHCRLNLGPAELRCAAPNALALLQGNSTAVTSRHGASEGQLEWRRKRRNPGFAVEVLACKSFCLSHLLDAGLECHVVLTESCLQRTYASDYIGLVLLLIGYLLVRLSPRPCPWPALLYPVQQHS